MSIPPPPTASASSPTKRPSSPLDAESTDHLATKRQRRGYRHHHRLQTRMRPDLLPDSAFTDPSTVDTLLKLSIGILLRDCGFTHADPVALDSFRSAVEEYILHILSYTRQSMSSCRRMQPIPPDFEHALRNTNIHLDALHEYLIPSLRQQHQQIPSLPSPPPSSPTAAVDLPFLGPELSGTAHRQLNVHIPKHFPNFPGRHTYRATPVFTARETDPRKIREKATEEGRLGEEALRKLARAGREGLVVRDGADANGDGHGEGEGEGGGGKRLWGRRLENMESMFEKTVRGVVGVGGGGRAAGDAGLALPSSLKIPDNGKLELSPIVNCDKVYWRKQTRADVRKTDQRMVHSNNDKGARGTLVQQRV
ncbi:bromodomain associated protein [Histoplasma capsulatum G186AR]|uniref:Transcription initiation factor TFIID subunit 8 n=2 Tax=Ajellomyces capsulatus TaxID=5037 RepID=C0NZK8_AJECG|nr:bromodomain associated protein [Histoplasma capsulatum G186AR]EEH03256.1 bromodomain associated protein [Histoplasma capsulatum G186AR]KAG5290336.1 bromodomain associated protein [Histoplasma capsulatum]QSS72263.1 bromodomain associated protein [Histoplasma capsulatum G186AR]